MPLVKWISRALLARTRRIRRIIIDEVGRERIDCGR